MIRSKRGLAYAGRRMIPFEPASSTDKPARYAQLLQQAGALFEGERDPVANAANLAALLWHGLPDINWAGIYRLDGGQLLLGPFQGKPACVRIAIGQGVCGTAAAQRSAAAARQAGSIVVKKIKGLPAFLVPTVLPCLLMKDTVAL